MSKQSALQRILSNFAGKAKQRNLLVSQLQRPATNDRDRWLAYWKACNLPWRTEPDIDPKRQEFLTQRRAINIEKGLYPFKGIKMSRADVEWLLVNHESGGQCGPVKWDDENQRNREGLDLRGADLSNTELSHLPLARIRCGLGGWNAIKPRELPVVFTEEQLAMAAALMEGTNLTNAALEGADLGGVQLENVSLWGASLEKAGLWRAHLKKATLVYANLKGASLFEARLDGANLREAQLDGAYFRDAHLDGADLIGADLKRADFTDACLEGACLRLTHLEGAILGGAQLKRVDLSSARLEGANLDRTHLEGANLQYAHLEKALLREAHLEETDLRGACLDGASLDKITLNTKKRVGLLYVDMGPRLVDVQWGTLNLTLVKWSRINILADEYEAIQKKYRTEEMGSHRKGEVKDRYTRLEEFEAAVRAYRQLVVALQAQGLNEDASRFAYRAHLLQKTVFRLQMIQSGVTFRQRLQMLGAWLFSWFLFLLAGYGYKLWRSFLSYLFIIGGFLGFYLLLSLCTAPHLTWDEALVLSMSSFHGRGFFPPGISLGDPYARIAVVEGFVGLFVEVTLIATFTQRFFGK